MHGQSLQLHDCWTPCREGFTSHYIYTHAYTQDTSTTMGIIDKIYIFLFNLETTGFFSCSPTKKQDICQIGVLSYTGASSFNRYIIPSTEFHFKASETSGFTTDCRGGKTILLLNQQEVEDTVSESQAISDLVAFLNTNSEPGSTILLIGYNSKGHDAPFLIKAFIDCGISMTIEERTLIFSDALPLIRKIAKDTKDPLGQKLATCKNLQRQTVHRKLFGITPYNDKDTHDAMRDVKQLKEIIAHPDFPFNRLTEHIVPIDDLVAKIAKPIAQKLSKQEMPCIKPTESKETAIQRYKVHNNPTRKRKRSNQDDYAPTSKRMKYNKVGTVN